MPLRQSSRDSLLALVKNTIMAPVLSSGSSPGRAS
ncbi:hypothetical protein LEMLEM_LOCUS24791 [Lemmus lemmus]